MSGNSLTTYSSIPSINSFPIYRSLQANTSFAMRMSIISYK